MRNFEVIDLTGIGMNNLTAERIVSEVVKRFPEKELEIKSKERMIGELIKNDIDDIDFQALNGLSLPIAIKVRNRGQETKHLDVVKRKAFCLEFTDISEDTYSKLELIEEAYLVLIDVCDHLSQDAIAIVEKYKNEKFVDSRFYCVSDLAMMANDYYSIDESTTYEIDELWFSFFG